MMWCELMPVVWTAPVVPSARCLQCLCAATDATQNTTHCWCWHQTEKGQEKRKKMKPNGIGHHHPPPCFLRPP
jgi:hypothetical protein